MKHLTRTLLAGAASLALLASPALAEGDQNTTPEIEAPDTSGTAGASGSMGTATGAAADQLTQQGYTDVQEKAGTTGTEGQATYTARNSAGAEVEVVVDTNTGEVVSETPVQSKDQ